MWEWHTLWEDIVGGVCGATDTLGCCIADLGQKGRDDTRFSYWGYVCVVIECYIRAMISQEVHPQHVSMGLFKTATSLYSYLSLRTHYFPNCCHWVSVDGARDLPLILTGIVPDMVRHFSSVPSVCTARKYYKLIFYDYIVSDPR